MYCVTLRLHDIKKLTLVSLEYAMEVHLADAYFYVSGESPPSKSVTKKSSICRKYRHKSICINITQLTAFYCYSAANSITNLPNK